MLRRAMAIHPPVETDGGTDPRQRNTALDEQTREACNAYVARLFASEDDVLRDLRREIRESDLPEIQISPEEGRLLQFLVRSVGARRVLELGTLGGYSAIWMARALPAGGRLLTVEREEARAELARRYLLRAGLEEVVEVLVGEAKAILEQLSGGEPFDAVFIDADKESYPDYLNWCRDNVRAGGLVIADNAFKSGSVVEDSDDPGVCGIQEYNRRIAEDPGLTSIIIPMRDGVAVSLIERGER